MTEHDPYRHVTTDPSDRRDQHSVTRSYLTDWCDPTTPNGAYLWVSPKDRSSPPKRLSPRRAFTVPDMNTLIKGGERNLALEAIYAQIETAFGKVKDKIVSGAEPVDKDIEAVVCFVAAQMVRTPKFRVGWSLAPPSDHQAQLDAISDPELRGAVERTTATLVENGQKIVSLLALPQAVKLLGQLRVTLLKTEDEFGFVTSDSPCCVIQYADQPGHALQCLQTPTGNVLFSLSPSVVAIFDHSPKKHQMIGLFPDQPIVIEANALLWRGADKWVVLPPCKKARPEWFDEAVMTKLARYAVI
jgi:hypothetical protein